MTIEIGFTILKWHAPDSPGARVTRKSPRKLVRTRSETEPTDARSGMVVFPKPLAVAMRGATLVAAWRDGGAAKRTRL